MLCTAGMAEYKNAFQSFAKNELQWEVKWVSSNTEMKLGSKYLLLFNVVTRIPDDLDSCLKDLRIEGKIQGCSKYLFIICFNEQF